MPLHPPARPNIELGAHHALAFGLEQRLLRELGFFGADLSREELVA